jgi:catechol 2,3-dioxygenase-like lactoylglutathione lyase family enzyme
MKINRILTNLCSQNLDESTEFYTSLFEFKVDYDSDWFVHLISEGRELEIGIIQSNHDLVPEEFRGKPSGMYITFVVDDAMAIYEKAKDLGIDIVKEPELTFYGQKRVLLKDPAGVLVDVSSPENV